MQTKHLNLDSEIETWKRKTKGLVNDFENLLSNIDNVLAHKPSHGKENVEPNSCRAKPVRALHSDSNRHAKANKETIQTLIKAGIRNLRDSSLPRGHRTGSCMGYSVRSDGSDRLSPAHQVFKSSKPLTNIQEFNITRPIPKQTKKISRPSSSQSRHSRQVSDPKTKKTKPRRPSSSVQRSLNDSMTVKRRGRESSLERSRRNRPIN